MFVLRKCYVHIFDKVCMKDQEGCVLYNKELYEKQESVASVLKSWLSNPELHFPVEWYSEMMFV